MNKKVWSSVAVAAFFTVAFASMFIGAVGCDPEAERRSNEAKRREEAARLQGNDFIAAVASPMKFSNGLSLCEVSYNGHNYTVATFNCRGCSIAHSPNCPCLKHDLACGRVTHEVSAPIKPPVKYPEKIEFFDGHTRTVLTHDKKICGCYNITGVKSDEVVEPKVVDEVK